MKYITNNETLKRYIPNVVTEVEGEADLFTKLTPHLKQAESWLEYRIVRPSAIPIPEDHSGSGSGSGSGAGESMVLEFVRIAVAAEAFRAAVPSLDLILTANGFGIVSNNTVAPASKERVASLIESLIETRDSAIEQLAAELSGAHHVLGGRIFSGYDLQRALGHSDHLLQHFLAERQKERAAESYVAEHAVSVSVMSELKTLSYGTSTLPEQYNILHDKVRTAIVAKMNDTLDRQLLADIVEFIRTNTDTFPGWEESGAATHWIDRTFKNDKNLGGVWL